MKGSWEQLGDAWWNSTAARTAVSCCEQPLENGHKTIWNAMGKGFGNFEIILSKDNYSRAHAEAKNIFVIILALLVNPYLTIHQMLRQ